MEVKICDFGLSRSINWDQEKIGIKEKRPMSPRSFTRFYRPPESILLEQYNEKADIWSLGCIISEIF